MSDVDFEHISYLFSIIEGCAEHTGKFGSIQTEAFNELMAINDGFRKKQMDKKAADEKALAEHAARQPQLKPEPKAIPSRPEPDMSLGAERVEDENADSTTLAERRI